MDRQEQQQYTPRPQDTEPQSILVPPVPPPVQRSSVNYDENQVPPTPRPPVPTPKPSGLTIEKYPASDSEEAPSTQQKESQERLGYISSPQRAASRAERPFSAVRQRSGLDWIVPAVAEPGERRDPYRQKTVGERLQPTLDVAKAEIIRYNTKARLTGWALNIAIGLQVLLGALTTGLSAALSGRQIQIATALLGGASTLVAAYLARARGSNEPELSITRAKDLDQFVRECEAFKMDSGHILTNEHDPRLDKFRLRFEELLGNANGERHLSSV